IPGVRVSESRNSDCEAAVAATIRLRPRSEIARRMAFPAWSAAALAKVTLSWNTLIRMLRPGCNLCQTSKIIQISYQLHRNRGRTCSKVAWPPLELMPIFVLTSFLRQGDPFRAKQPMAGRGIYRRRRSTLPFEYDRAIDNSVRAFRILGPGSRCRLDRPSQL